VVGSDETGIKINGEKGWFWTWQNKLMTYIAFSTNRGFASIETNFAKGFQKAVLVHIVGQVILKQSAKHINYAPHICLEN
jgi:hypothetical protein